MSRVLSMADRSVRNAEGESRLLFRAEMLTGERILWTGRPLPRLLFQRSDWISVPLSIFFAGLAFMWEFVSIRGILREGIHDAPWLTSAIWAVPFFGFAQYLLWGRFLRNAQKKQHTFYAVTNRRVLVLSTGPRRRITDGLIAGLDSISFVSGANGTGTIAFTTRAAAATSPGWTGPERRKAMPGADVAMGSLVFLDIPNARTVYRMIQAERERGHAV